MRLLVIAAALIAVVLAIAPKLRAPSVEGEPASTSGEGKAAEPVATALSVSTAPARPGEGLAIARGPAGHFTTGATVNGATIPMVIDSGATLVVLRREDALAAGISVFPAEFTGSAQTAGGTVKTKRVVLDRISIGGIERRNVAAAVVDADLPMSLLGQSFLAQLGEVRIAGDEMILR